MPKTRPDENLANYTPVAERIALFYQAYPKGRITTRLIRRTETESVVKAFVYRDQQDTLPAATGLAAERERDGEINISACLENTETSAIGRALANCGFQGSAKRPSREEMEKVARVKTVTAKARGAQEISEDALELVRAVERAGGSKKMISAVRERLNQPGSTKETVERVERAVRQWLVTHPPPTGTVQ